MTLIFLCGIIPLIPKQRHLFTDLCKVDFPNIMTTGYYIGTAIDKGCNERDLLQVSVPVRE